MTVYVDPLMRHGWVMRGRTIPSCHMFTDKLDLAELHTLAGRIGLKRSWFQHDTKVPGSLPHYDLTPSRRALAVEAGAREVSRHEAVTIWRSRRSLLTS